MLPFSLLYPMAIGDAFGMKYEFVEHPIPVDESQLFYGPHPKFKEYKTGHYTDDTQMALANAELLLAKGPHRRVKRDFVAAWIDCFRRDPRSGYSRYMFGLLSRNPSPEEFCGAIDASKGTTSGGAMRVAPIGLLDRVDTVTQLAVEQARITHNTPAGTTSALAVALSVHFLHHGGDGRRLPDFLCKQIGSNWASSQNGLSDDPNNGLKIVTQSLAAVQSGPSLAGVLLAGVSQSPTADTDTICAVAMAIASRCKDAVWDIPKRLEEGLETGPYGRDYLTAMDKKLANRFPAKNLYGDYGLR